MLKILVFSRNAILTCSNKLISEHDFVSLPICSYSAFFCHFIVPTGVVCVLCTQKQNGIKPVCALTSFNENGPTLASMQQKKRLVGGEFAAAAAAVCKTSCCSLRVMHTCTSTTLRKPKRLVLMTGVEEERKMSA